MPASAHLQAANKWFYTAVVSPASSSHRLYVPLYSGGTLSQTGAAATLLPAGALLRPLLQIKPSLPRRSTLNFVFQKHGGRITCYKSVELVMGSYLFT